MFADDLDQCVHPFLTGPPCGTGGPATDSTYPTTASLPIWPPTTFPPITLPPATRPPTTLPPPTALPPATPPPATLPPPTQPPTTWPPLTLPSTLRPNTTLAPFVLLCHFRSEDCSVYEPCPPDTKRRTLCTGCYISGTFIDLDVLCPGEGRLYDRDHRECIPDPDSKLAVFPVEDWTRLIVVSKPNKNFRIKVASP